MATVLKTTDTRSAVDELAALLGDRLSTSRAVCEHHATGETYHAPHPPDAVTFPETTEEVAEIVRICAAHGVPMVPYGVGTSVEGNVCALEGGVTLDMGRMNKVLRVSQEDLDVTVQAGVTRKQLNTDLRDTGLFFPIDPGSGRDARRHDRDARLRHQRRALRHAEGERARPHRGVARRASH